jgi:hypothetical protein
VRLEGARILFGKTRAEGALCAFNHSATSPTLHCRAQLALRRSPDNQSAPSLAERGSDLQAALGRSPDFPQLIDDSILSPKNAYQ